MASEIGDVGAHVFGRAGDLLLVPEPVAAGAGESEGAAGARGAVAPEAVAVAGLQRDGSIPLGEKCGITTKKSTSDNMTPSAKIDNPVTRHFFERASHNPLPIAAKMPVMRSIVSTSKVCIQGKSYSSDCGNGYTSNLK